MHKVSIAALAALILVTSAAEAQTYYFRHIGKGPKMAATPTVPEPETPPAPQTRYLHVEFTNGFRFECESILGEGLESTFPGVSVSKIGTTTWNLRWTAGGGTRSILYSPATGTASGSSAIGCNTTTVQVLAVGGDSFPTTISASWIEYR